MRSTSLRHLMAALKRATIPSTVSPKQPEPPPHVPEQTLQAVLQTGITIGERRASARLLPQTSIYNVCDVCGKPLVEMLLDGGVPCKRCPDNEDSRHRSGPIPRVTISPSTPIPAAPGKTIIPNPTRVKGEAREIETRRNMMVSRLINMKARDRLRVPPSIVTQETIVVPAVSAPVVRMIEAPATREDPTPAATPLMPSWGRASNTSALSELEDFIQTAKVEAVKMKALVQKREERYQGI